MVVMATTDQYCATRWGWDRHCNRDADRGCATKS